MQCLEHLWIEMEQCDIDFEYWVDLRWLTPSLFVFLLPAVKEYPPKCLPLDQLWHQAVSLPATNIRLVFPLSYWTWPTADVMLPLCSLMVLVDILCWSVKSVTRNKDTKYLMKETMFSGHSVWTFCEFAQAFKCSFRLLEISPFSFQRWMGAEGRVLWRQLAYTFKTFCGTIAPSPVDISINCLLGCNFAFVIK